MKRVPGSFTGEALCSELIEEISQVKKLKNNAMDIIDGEIKLYRAKSGRTIEENYKILHSSLKVSNTSLILTDLKQD